MDVEKVFANVTGRKMSPDEVTRYLKFQKEFEVPDTDPTWMIFVWFEFYQRIFEQFPEKARKEAEEGARELRKASIAVTEASAAVVKESRDKAVGAIEKLQEKAKGDIANALGPILVTKIGEAVDELKSHSNRPLHKRWLIVTAVAIVVALGLGGWGTYVVHKNWVAEGEGNGYAKGFAEASKIVTDKSKKEGEKKGYAEGYAKGVAVNPAVKSFYSLFYCNIAGWTVDREGEKFYCVPGPDPTTGEIKGVRVR